MAKEQQQITNFSPAGNRTPVSRVTVGDIHHYTTEETDACLISRVTVGILTTILSRKQMVIGDLVKFFQ